MEKPNRFRRKNVMILVVAWIIIGLLIGLMFFLRSDDDDRYSVTIEPQVTLTNNTYNYSSIYHTFWSTPIRNEFNIEYGPRYSEKLRNNIVVRIKEQVTALGENATELEECLRVTGRLDETKIEIMPCAAEKGKFEYYSDIRGKDFYVEGFDLNDYHTYVRTVNNTTLVQEDCWIFVFNWGGEEEEFGHVKIYVVATSDRTVLCYLTCK